MARGSWIRVEQEGRDIFIKGGELSSVVRNYFTNNGIKYRLHQDETDCVGFSLPGHYPVSEVTTVTSGLVELLKDFGYLVNPENLEEPLLTFSPAFLGLNVH